MPHDPLWSRELSEDEKRLIWNGRAEPDNPCVRKISFNLPEKDAVFCHKQGMVFMEAADPSTAPNVQGATLPAMRSLHEAEDSSDLHVQTTFNEDSFSNVMTLPIGAENVFADVLKDLSNEVRSRAG